MSAAVDKDPSGETGMKGLGGLDLGTPESGVRGSQEVTKWHSWVWYYKFQQSRQRQEVFCKFEASMVYIRSTQAS